MHSLRTLFLLFLCSVTVPVAAATNGPPPSALDKAAEDVAQVFARPVIVESTQPETYNDDITIRVGTRQLNGDGTGSATSHDLRTKMSIHNAKPIILHKVLPRSEILFGENLATLNERAQRFLDRLVEQVSRNPNPAPVAIVGHTDRSGSYEANKALSLARAEAVADYLRSRISAKIEARGEGYDHLLPNISPRSPLNRRVEVVGTY